MRLFIVAQFAAAPLRRTAVALLPPSANSNQYCQNHPRHSNRQPSVCDANPHFVRWHDATYCSSSELRGPQPRPAEARNSHSLVRGLRRLPPAPIDEPFDQKKYPTPVRASDTLIIIYRETTRGTTAEYPPPRPNRSRPPHWDPWRASAGSSKDWRPGPPSAIRAQP